MNDYAHWTFAVVVSEQDRREWRMSDPYDADQVFWCYAERVTRRDGSKRWQRRYARTMQAPDLSVAEMETMFKERVK